VNGDLFLGASSDPAARAGYPLVTLPAGFSFGLPVGLTFMGRAYSEPTLIKLAYAFEQGTKVRRPPRFRRSLEDELSGGSARSQPRPKRRNGPDVSKLKGPVPRRLPIL